MWSHLPSAELRALCHSQSPGLPFDDSGFFLTTYSSVTKRLQACRLWITFHLKNVTGWPKSLGRLLSEKRNFSDIAHHVQKLAKTNTIDYFWVSFIADLGWGNASKFEKKDSLKANKAYREVQLGCQEVLTAPPQWREPEQI